MVKDRGLFSFQNLQDFLLFFSCLCQGGEDYADDIALLANAPAQAEPC